MQHRNATSSRNRPPVNSAPVWKRLLLGILVLVSGFCGISYEILFGRILGNLAGDQFTVSGAVLLTFLLGLGTGAFAAHRLWRWLWAIEAGIGLCGLGFAFGTAWLDRLLYFREGALLPLCVGLLLVPSFLIGASLPIFAGWLRSLAPGAAFSRSYALYNFGAAAMVLLAEFWLVRQFGIRLATVSVAALNGAAALMLLACFRNPPAPPPSIEPRSARWPWRTLAALSLAGVASAIFQLTMLRVAECLLGPFRETFAFVLALVLLGIALGSVCVRRWNWSFAGCMIVSLMALVWLLTGLPTTMRGYAAGYEAVAQRPVVVLLYKTLMLAALMLVPAMGFGATVPALLGAGKGHLAKDSGRLLFYVSLANAAGFALMTSWLHLRLDYGVLLLTVAALACLALWMNPGSGWTARAAAPLLVVAALLAQRKAWDEDLLYIGHGAFRSPETLREKWAGVDASERYKGRNESFSIARYDGDPYFFTNGYISIPLHAPSEKLVGAFAAIHAPRADRALVLGVGSGATAGTVGKLFERTDAVEINQAVLDNLHRMKEYSFDIENDPNIRILHDDGVHFVKSGCERYSLVVNTVTNPLYFSSSKLYTTDFYELVKRRMTPDGVYATSFDSSIGEEGADIMLRTAMVSFRHVAVGIIKGSYYLLLCSDQSIRPWQPRLVADHPWIGRFFREQYELRPEWLLYGQLLTDAGILLGNPACPLNTLDRPELEFAMARLTAGSNYPAFTARVEEAVDTWEVAMACEGLVDYNPHHHLLHLESLVRGSAAALGLRRRLEESDPEFAAQCLRAELEQVERETSSGDAAKAYFLYGKELASRGDYAEALAQFSRALELRPGFSEAYFRRGLMHEYFGQLDEAMVDYEHLMSLVPDDPEAAYRIGSIHVRRRRFAEAIPLLRRAQELRPENVSVRMYLEQAEAGLLMDSAEAPDPL